MKHETMEHNQYIAILEALNANNWNIFKAAKSLNIPTYKLDAMIKHFGLREKLINNITDSIEQQKYYLDSYQDDILMAKNGIRSTRENIAILNKRLKAVKGY